MFLIRFQNFYYSSKQLSHSGVCQIAKGLIEPRGTSWADWKCGEPRPKAVEAREGSTSNAGRRGTAWFMSQEWQPSPTASFISLTWGMLLRGKPMEMGQCFKNAPFFYAQNPSTFPIPWVFVSTFCMVLSASPLRLAPGTAAFIRRLCYFQLRPAAMTTRYPAAWLKMCCWATRETEQLAWWIVVAGFRRLRSSWSNHQISFQTVWVPDSHCPKPQHAKKHTWDLPMWPLQPCSLSITSATWVAVICLACGQRCQMHTFTCNLHTIYAI